MFKVFHMLRIRIQSRYLKFNYSSATQLGGRVRIFFIGSPSLVRVTDHQTYIYNDMRSGSFKHSGLITLDACGVIS